MQSPGNDTFVEFTDVVIQTREGPRNGLVATPTRRPRFSRRWLERLRAGEASGNRVNPEILAEIDRRGPDAVHAVIFQARTPREIRSFDPDITDDEVVEFGYHMLRQQLSMFRRTIPMGVRVVAGVEFGPRELYGYDRGAARLADELEARVLEGDPAIRDDAQLDLWILERVVRWSNLSVDEYVARRLPEMLGSSQRKRRQLLDLLDRAEPPHA